MQFINYSNLDSPKMGKVSKEQLVNALLEHETKNKSRVDKLVEGLGEEVEFSTAISLFSNKLQATTTLSVVEKKEVIESTPEKTLTWESVLEKIEKMPTVAEAEMNEKSINKIQKEWNKVTAMLKDTVELWKSAEGKEKEDLLTQLKTLTISKNKLEAELDVAIGLKDADVELVGEAKDDFMAKHSGTNITLKKGYKHHTEDELTDLYNKIGELVKDDLKVKDVTIVFESAVNEAKHSSTDFSKPGNDGDIYFSKREGDAVGVRQGDKLQMIYVFQEEPKLGRIQKSDKRWKNMGPASEELLIDLIGRAEGKILFDFVSTLEESVVTEGKDDYVARYDDTNINLKKGYKHLNDEELKQIYLEIGELIADNKLKVKDATLTFESVVTGSVPSKEDLKAYINKNREEIDNLVDNDAWDKAYAMVLNDFSIESETPEGESMITLFNEIY